MKETTCRWHIDMVEKTFNATKCMHRTNYCYTIIWSTGKVQCYTYLSLHKDLSLFASIVINENTFRKFVFTPYQTEEYSGQ